jgi:hypothetical protein
LASCVPATLLKSPETAKLSGFEGNVLTGVATGRRGFVRRRWLVQHFDQQPALAVADRRKAAEVIAARSMEFDAVTYFLGGDKPQTWSELKKAKRIDCSGWVQLLGFDIFSAYGLTTKPSILRTMSDDQVTSVGSKTGVILSTTCLTDDVWMPGVLVGLDFSEYSWDRGRPLDIDHIVAIGHDSSGLFVSQSSSSGGGVNRVPFAKWRASVATLVSQGRAHAVDLLMLP